MSQPYDPSGQQPQQWGATPAPQQGSPVPSAAPAGYGAQPGYPQQGQAQQPQQPQPAQQAQPQQGYGAPAGQQVPGYGAPGAPQGWAGAPAPAEPGPLARLFDTSLTRFFSPGHLKGAMMMVYVVAGAVVLSKVIDSILVLSYGGPAAVVVRGIFSLLLAPVWGLGVALAGRLVIELLAHVAALRSTSDGAAARAEAAERS